MSALSNPTPVPVQQPPQRITPVSPAEPPKKKSPVGWIVFGLLLLGVVAGYELWYKPQQERAARQTAVTLFRTTKVIAGPFERTLRVGGATAARDFSNITTPRMRGPEARNLMELLSLVKNGTWVNKGDVLAQIDPGTINDHVDDLRATILQADNDVKKRVSEQLVEMGSLDQTLRVAQASVDKAKWDNQASEVRTDIEQELLRLAYEESQAKYKQSQLDVPQKKTIHGAELKILDFTKERHARHLGRHENDIKAYTIRATMTGMVVLSSTYRGGGESQQVQQGDALTSGQPLLKIVNPKSMSVEATVNQTESGEIRIGQTAQIGLDAFPGMTFKGKVYSIGALAVSGGRQNYYIRSVPIRVTIDGADPKLIPDLSAFADIVVEQKENATLVPLGAIHEEGKKSFVYVKKGEGWEKREISLGSSNNLYAIANSGVTSGDELRLD